LKNRPKLHKTMAHYALFTSGFFESPCMSEAYGAGPRPTALGLDLEAASSYRETATSPESINNGETMEEVVFFQDQEGFPESSPSSGSAIDKMDTLLDRQVGFENVGESHSRALRRRQTSFAKHKRMSLFASAVNPAGSILNNRKSLFVRPPRASFLPSEPLLELSSEPAFCPPAKALMEDRLEDRVHEAVLENDTILQAIFVFLPEHELLRTASLVCSKWANAATHSHAQLMLMSVGCAGIPGNFDDDSDDESCGEDDVMAIPGLMERPWQYLTSNFPWACFLSEGAFKQVFKVFNHNHQVEEAVSVM
jgi:hypothetical protein